MPIPAANGPRHRSLDTFTSFGALLLFLRRRAQLRQRELAQAVGYSEAQIGRLENGQRLPDVAAVMAQFIPALDLDSEPELADRLVELAHQARLPVPVNAGEVVASTPIVPVEPEAIDTATTVVPRGSVPQQPTPFLSRARELGELAALLEQAAHRCVTLLGPGGVGKTRLALEAATRHAPHFAHGAYVVALTGIASPDALAPTITEALQLPSPRDGDVVAQLQHFLGSKHVLLVLDNMEHVVEGADVVAALLLAAPRLHVLATSRERLHLRGEVVLELEGFAVPSPALVREEQLSANDAVALFVGTARRTRHDWMPDPDDWPAIATVCRLSEGFPLAIELAASWVRMLSCAEIARELEQTWDLLHTTMRDLPPRHRSMRVAFTHSWELLTRQEQQALRGLSVFRGSWTREAAAAVLAMSSSAVLPVLGSLADKSMVKRVNAADGSRYALHEVVRQGAAEQLHADADEEHAAHVRHGSYYLDRLCAREAAIRGTAQHTTLEEISADGDNLRAALDWAVVQRDTTTLRRVLPVLLVYLEWRYTAAEGVPIFTEIAASLKNSDPAQWSAEHRTVLALALGYTGWCSLFVGRSKEAVSLLREAHALLGDGDDQLVRGDILLFLGFVTGNTGDTATGRRLLVASIRAFEACGDGWRVARGLYRLGMVMHQDGLYVGAQQVFTACLARLETIGDPRATALTLNRLGITDALLGRHAQAQRRIQRSLLHSSAAHDQRGIASALFHLGSLAQHNGEHRAARYFFGESLDLFGELNERASVADALAQIGFSAVHDHDWDDARRAFDDAWRIVRDAEVNTTGLSLLVSCAALDLATDRCERGVEALTLALYHPVSEQATRDRAAHLLKEAEARLTPFQFMTARQRGREASFGAYKP